MTQDEKLRGNDKIEEAVEALQKEPTQERLAHTLTVIRRRMREEGEFIVAVEPISDGSQLKLQTISTEDGCSWWPVFTSFEEEMKGSNQVMSTFMGSIRQLFEMALQTEEIEGIILNPWNRTIMLDKTLIRIVLA